MAAPAKLFLGGVSPNTSKESIEQHFSKYGTVIDAVVMYKDGKHRGFGFVTFDSFDGMALALSEPQELDGRIIDVKEAVPRPEGQQAPVVPQINQHAYGPRAATPAGGGSYGKGGKAPTNNQRCDKVFIGGLTQTTTEDMVIHHFSQYGNLIDAVVMKDKESQRSRGFGFVQYDNEDSVEHVMRDYKHHNIDGKWIECKKAIPQDRVGKGGGGNFQAVPNYQAVAPPSGYGGAYGAPAAAPSAYGGHYGAMAKGGGGYGGGGKGYANQFVDFNQFNPAVAGQLADAYGVYAAAARQAAALGRSRPY